jgi:hypothetical protein
MNTVILLFAILATMLALLYTGLVYVGNKGSLHDIRDPNDDLWLIVTWVVVAVVWLIWKWM